MKQIFQLALDNDGSGVKKWVDLRDPSSYGFHKTMGREVRVVYQNPPMPEEKPEEEDGKD